MLDLTNAEKIERPVPVGMYQGPPTKAMESTAEEVLRSIQGQMSKQLLQGYEQPKLRVTSRGTIQMVWEKPWGGAAVSVAEWNYGGSVGFERFSKGDLPPDPELASSYPLGHVISEAVAFLSREP